MKKRHGQRPAIRRAEALALADVEAVVQNVAVRQHDAFREPGGPGGVLHHDDIVVVELLARPLE